MKKNEYIKKYLAAALVLLLAIGVFGLFAVRKSGMFVDEVYTYALSNSSYAPFLPDLKGGVFPDVVYTAEEIDDYLTVQDGEGFDVRSVYYNQTRDVHPPLYYWFINFVSTLARGSCSKWIGLSVNLVFFVLTLAVLRRLALLLFDSADVACAVTALYGISRLALSCAMMIRMYMLLTFFTVLLAFFCALLLKTGDSRRLCPMIGLTIFLGLMTQYYFVFYAFFLCAAMGIVFLSRKDLGSFCRFSAFALLGVALMVLAFPACLRQLFEGNGQVVGGANVLSALTNTAAYGKKLTFFLTARFQLKAVKWVTLAALVCLLPLLGRLPGAVKEGRLPSDALVIVLPAIPAFLAVAILSPVEEHRYLYNLTPLFVLGAGIPLSLADRLSGHFPHKEAVRKALLALIVLAALYSAKQAPPANLFPAQKEYDAIVAEVADLPCVYISDGYYAPVMQDLPELRAFPEFLVAGNASSEALKTYLEGRQEAVVYIDTSPFWSSGYDAKKVLASLARNTGFTESELLYQYDFEGYGGLSETYLVRRG